MKIINKILKLAGILIISLLIIIIGLGLLIQTPFGKSKIADYTSSIISSKLNGQLTIGKLNGNFFNSLSLSNVLLTDQKDTVIYIANLEAKYDLWSLWARRIQIYSVNVSSPLLKLRQENDSVWNINQLILPTTKQTNDTPTETPYFEADIANFRINEGKVFIRSNDSLLPRQTQSINIIASCSYTPDKQSLKISDFNLSFRHPDLDIRKISFDLERHHSFITLNELKIETSKNNFLINGQYNPTKTSGKLLIKSDPINWDEFRSLTGNLKLRVHPELQLESQLTTDSLHFKLNLKDSIEQILLSGTSDNFADYFFNQNQKPLHYRLALNMKHINLKDWTGYEELNTLINGHLTSEGIGYHPDNAILKLRGTFTNSKFENYTLSQLLLNVNYNKNDLIGQLSGHSSWGNIKIHSKIRLINQLPSYQIEIQSQKLDLAEFTGNKKFRSSLNLSAQIDGKGNSLNTLQSTAQIYLNQSQIANTSIDTLNSYFNYKKGQLIIDSLRASTPASELFLEGNYNPKDNSLISGNIDLKNFNDLIKYVPGINSNSKGTIGFKIVLNKDSIQLASHGLLKQTNYADWKLDSLTFAINGNISSKDTLIKSSMIAYQLNHPQLKLDTIQLKANYLNGQLNISNQIFGKELSSDLNSEISLQPKLIVKLNSWKVRYKTQNLELVNSPAIFRMDSSFYSIENFKLAENTSDTAQYIQLEGKYSTDSLEDLKFKTGNIELSQLAAFVEPSVPLSGKFYSSFHLSGSAQQPVLSANYQIKNSNFGDYPIPEISGNINYQTNKVSASTSMNPTDTTHLKLNIELPVSLRLDSMQYKLDKQDSLSVQLDIHNFPLSVFKPFIPNGTIQGQLESQLNLEGSIDKPYPSGQLHVKNAILEIPTYGINYHSMTTDWSVKPGEIRMDSVYIKSNDGYMTGNGKINIDSTLVSKIDQSSITLKFNRFNPLDHKQFNLQVSGTTDIFEKNGDLRFNGDLTVPQSKLYLPFLFNMMGKMNDSEAPESILAQKIQELKDDSIQNSQNDSINQSIQTPPILKKITGRIKVSIPRNSWIKNDDMHLELSGDLEVLKHPETAEIFGTIDVVRGQYDLFGRTFSISDGSTITFQGGEDLMPNLNLIATYTFRNSEKVEQTLEVTIDGKASSPTIAFTLDDESIEEGDALSYILFGKSIDELSLSQQENVSSAGSIAESAAASLLSAQLTNYIGKKINLDYIEVKSSGGFDSASLTLGKYITHKLFVSYEQQIGQNSADDDNTNSYEVKLEYELFKFLFLQLDNSDDDSGFDLIYKFRSK